MQTDGHLFGIGTESIQGIYRRTSRIVIEVTIRRIILQIGFVSISICTITTTIYVTPDTGIDTHGITTIHLTRYIITAIHIVDITTTHQHTSSKTCREVVLQLTLLVNIRQVVDRNQLSIIIMWLHIGHTTATIDIVNDQFMLNLPFLGDS